eukprot:4923500-Lingulodinium_polyedra.AAC.1
MRRFHPAERAAAGGHRQQARDPARGRAAVRGRPWVDPPSGEGAVWGPRLAEAARILAGPGA